MTVNELSLDETKHIAQLARLALTDEELLSYKNELNAVLEVVQALNEVPTDNLVETAQVSGMVNSLRADTVTAELSRADALLNAPQTDGKHFTVPVVL